MSSDPIPGARDDAAGGPGLVPAFTLAVWLGCAAVGLAGLLAPAPPSSPPPPTSQPAVQVVSVVLEAAPTPVPPTPSPPTGVAAAAETPAMAADVPPVPTAAVPSPAVAFAVPVAGPVRVAAAAPLSGPAVQRITLGRGAGDQPRPDYPEDARRAGEQGTVTVRLGVDADGRVTRAWAAGPSPFPALNRAAVDVVRDAWRFAPGPARLFEVPITFRLNAAG